jgi:hypothetical protein
MKSSFHSLIPFLPLFCKCQFNSIRSSYPGRLASRTRLYYLLLYAAEHFFITTLHEPRRKHSLSVVEKACLLFRCLAMDVLFLRAYASAQMCLPSRRLAMGLYVTICSRDWACLRPQVKHTMKIRFV